VASGICARTKGLTWPGRVIAVKHRGQGDVTRRLAIDYNGAMLVRHARLEDLPAVARLAAELVRMHHGLDPPRFMLVEPIEDGYQWFFARELERKKRALILVVEDDDAIIGYAYGTLQARNWNDLLDACGKLEDVYVDPRVRRRGAGRALVNEMLETLRARGAPRVILLSAWRNPEAHAFFESLGFRRTMLEMTRES
jgi:ribosomal protein S18 acetylase RimI-like enzyme